jgi:hypothetical protein
VRPGCALLSIVLVIRESFFFAGFVSFETGQVMTTRVRRFENSHSASDVHEVNTIALVTLNRAKICSRATNFSLAALSFSITNNYINSIVH